MSTDNKETSMTAPAKTETRSLSRRSKMSAAISEKEAQEIERRIKVYQYRVRGYSLRRIAQEMKMSVGTVRRDLDKITKEMAHQFEDFNPEAFVADEMVGYEDLMQEGWNQYHQSKNVHQAVKALDFIRGVKTDRFNMLKNAGVIKTEPVNVQHNVAVGVIQNWDEGFKKAAVEALIQANMGGRQLAAPVPDDMEKDNVIDVGEEEEVLGDEESED